MANQPNPDNPYRFPDDPYRSAGDPYRSGNDAYRSPLTDDEIHRPARLDNELQPDPELTEVPASGGRVALLAVAVAVMLGVVFYGLNNAPVHQAGTSSTAQSSTAQNSAPETPLVAPPGMRDVTPRANMQPGVTTGAAPANPKAPPATAPSGAASNGSTQ
jgi:hypothetical protein